MKIYSAFNTILTSVFLLAAGSVLAQATPANPVDDQADVWALIEAQWSAEAKGDKKWMDQLLTDDFSGWGKESPAPRGKASTKMWDRLNDEVSQMVAHELYPLSIVVHDDIAIAHYLFTSANKSKSKDGKIETSNGRYTDILVRTDEGWKFIAWSGGSDD
ncbi:MAG: nuclear transport factor 2 family protein [Gammaproteobacteria bacterium]|nr:nuclear transport factor 2 family protein [Gammaproteobacteria bacterium]MBT8111064.1 nuclear transport factor 2 family protein [Gammaproteobacteria bacterium]NND47981.1 nuclear transport factor 2 family protein [Woeseiaceae bacterium]NNL45762.1 nuclear transport factor 2 family protein [Woeseiaceae bacterium]